MPFIEADRRLKALNGEIAKPLPGDRCFVFYAEMMKRWRVNPRWATADNIYEWVKLQDSFPPDQRAKELAWQVFFNFHVLPYEDEQQAKNGDI